MAKKEGKKHRESISTNEQMFNGKFEPFLYLLPS